ncbi:hypothetical protein [Alkaliphilus sp. B6464]|uniref:hypothetical protein n=1 Tax=Alkaliphilus sp. B6464 TaxID=2731219 RepID=UPI001BA53C19|nr:hypothetical protein [Alkaliphilus sp. B6464]QUH22001.1 hypothetical protein HYG84_19035 [Alkaliphilus sp. B6464]
MINNPFSKGVIAMKKLLNRKGDGLSGVTFTIIMVVIVLLAVPSFRALQKDNAKASQNLGNQIVNITTP